MQHCTESSSAGARPEVRASGYRWHVVSTGTLSGDVLACQVFCSPPDFTLFALDMDLLCFMFAGPWLLPHAIAALVLAWVNIKLPTSTSKILTLRPSTVAARIPHQYLEGMPGLPTGMPTNGGLSSLLPELLREIMSYLPGSARISTKLVNRQLLHGIAIPPSYRFSGASQCERHAILRYIYEYRDVETSRRRCALCFCLRSLLFFRDGGLVCTFEDGRVMKIGIPACMESPTKERLRGLEDRAERPYWVALPRLMCTHYSTRVIQWNGLDCNCNCDSCAHVQVMCYIRISRGRELPTKFEISNMDGDIPGVSEEEYAGSSRSLQRSMASEETC